MGHLARGMNFIRTSGQVGGIAFFAEERSMEPKLDPRFCVALRSKKFLKSSRLFGSFWGNAKMNI